MGPDSGIPLEKEVGTKNEESLTVREILEKHLAQNVRLPDLAGKGFDTCPPCGTGILPVAGYGRDARATIV